jgi:hypothetical protein
MRMGARPVATNSLPVVTGDWRAIKDSAGITYYLTRTSFAELDAWSRATFGAPIVAVETNLSGFPQSVWAAHKVGIAIQLVGGAESQKVILLKSIRIP